HFTPKLRIPIKDQMLEWMLVWKCLSQLLLDPKAVWMSGHMEMQNAPTIMSNHEEAIQNTKCERRDGEEIHGGDCFTLIAQECLPKPACLRPIRSTSNAARDGSLRDLKPKHQQFPVNAWRTPRGIFRNHLENKFAQFPADALAANLVA